MVDNNGKFVTWEQNTYVNLDKCNPRKRKDALNITLSISTFSSTSNPKMPTVNVDFKFPFKKNKS